VSPIRSYTTPAAKTAATPAPHTAAAAAAAAAAAVPTGVGAMGPGVKLIDVERLPAEAAVSALIAHAITLPASDVFFATNEQHTAVQVRHWGMVRNIAIISSDQGKRIISHIKARAGLDLTNVRKPLDGRWIYSAADSDQTVDLRINSIPTVHGEDMAVRLFMRDSALFDLDYLGMNRDQLNNLRGMLGSPGGLILITGPTGSGKSATLYACLAHLNDGNRKINTIEDPVEFVIEGLRQSQVHSAIDLSFSELLRSVLRQSPDVIMIGEIRDAATAQTAVHAANSGHLVLATVHAASSTSAVQSMRSLGVHAHFLASCLRGVVSQRLVRTLCPTCKTSFDVPDDTFADVKHLLDAGEGSKLYAPHGCPECYGTGYAGRTGLFEVMPVSRSIKTLIADGATTADLRNKAIDEGMAEFRQSALLKVAHGVTSTEEVFRVIPAENLLLD
jgi:type II secretory ATPase GspE/PulE/Tfp pilus assembly ATPase PilB-like protein